MLTFSIQTTEKTRPNAIQIYSLSVIDKETRLNTYFDQKTREKIVEKIKQDHKPIESEPQSSRSTGSMDDDSQDFLSSPRNEDTMFPELNLEVSKLLAKTVLAGSSLVESDFRSLVKKLSVGKFKLCLRGQLSTRQILKF